MAIYNINGDTVASDSGGSSGVAKEKLTGKVLIAIGDSYTAGMNTQYTSLATKYGMILDNRGVVSATISYRGTDSYRRIYNIVGTIITDYTNGKEINGTTYYADDVGVITFMGGANDGAGIDAWIGTGVHETDKSTIYGSLNYIFSSLRETFTKATLICITQPSFYNSQVSGLSTDAQAQEQGFADLAEAQVFDDVQYTNYLEGMKESAVRNSAWYYGVPLVDMFNEFPPVTNPDNRTTYWNNDKLHLTTAGYNLIAAAIEKKIVDLVGVED